MHTNSSDPPPWGDEFIEAADALEESAKRQGFANLIRMFASEDVLQQVVGHILLEVRSEADMGGSLGEWITGGFEIEEYRHADFAWCWNWLDLWWDYDGIEWFPGGEFSFQNLGIFFPPEE